MNYEQRTQARLESALRAVLGNRCADRFALVAAKNYDMRWMVNFTLIAPIYFYLLGALSFLTGHIQVGVAHSLVGLAAALGVGMLDARLRLDAYIRAVKAQDDV